MQQNVLAAQKVVTNVRFDQSKFRNQQQRAPVQTETYDVLENEILVVENKQRVIDNYRLPRLQSWWRRGATDAETNEALLKYSFYGIAVTPHTASVKYMIDQGFVACIAGICKATNESSRTIQSGQLLTYELNSGTVKQRGVPRNKTRFTFVAYDPTEETHKQRGIVAKALSNAKQHSPYDVLIFPRGQVNPGMADSLVNMDTLQKDAIRAAFDAAHTAD